MSSMLPMSMLPPTATPVMWVTPLAFSALAAVMPLQRSSVPELRVVGLPSVMNTATSGTGVVKLAVVTSNAACQLVSPFGFARPLMIASRPPSVLDTST